MQKETLEIPQAHAAAIEMVLAKSQEHRQLVQHYDETLRNLIEEYAKAVGFDPVGCEYDPRSRQLIQVKPPVENAQLEDQSQ